MGRLLAIQPPFDPLAEPRPQDWLLGWHRETRAKPLDETVDERHLGDPVARRAFDDADDRIFLERLFAAIPDARDREIVMACIEHETTADRARALGMTQQSLRRAIRRLAPIIGPFLG